MTSAPSSTRRNAVILFSGGLDSILAARTLLDQGIGLHALHFDYPFMNKEVPTPEDAGKRSRAELSAGRLGIPFRRAPLGEEYLDIVRRPAHGRGKGMNPCIDCRILSIRLARAFMEEIGASFLVTGEVVGQRPMSQRDDAMRIIDRESGCGGLVLRPLSAKLLPPTLPEIEGWVDRERLHAIWGRSRREQLRLAREWGIEEFPGSGGGCLLTDRTFSVKVRDLAENDPGFGLFDVHLLKFGRHFRVGPVKAVVAKSEEENRRLETFCRGKAAVYVSESHPGPSVVLLGGSAGERMVVLSRVLTRYSSARRPGPYQVLEISPGGERRVTVPEDPDFSEVGRGILC